MHWLTIVILLFLLLNAWTGWRKGLIRRVLEFAGLIISILLAIHLLDFSSTMLFSMGMPAGAARILGWLTVFVICLVGTRFAAWAVSKMVRMSLLGWLDRWGGALLGLIGGMILGSVLLMVATHSPGADDLQDVIREHAIPRTVYATAPFLYDLLVTDEADVGELWDRARSELEHLQEMREKAEDVGDTINHLRED